VAVAIGYRPSGLVYISNRLHAMGSALAMSYRAILLAIHDKQRAVGCGG
jgi:hypothetical protein